jgi:hypothetical protein
MGASYVFNVSGATHRRTSDYTYDLRNGTDNNFVEIILFVLCPEIFDQLGEVGCEWLQRIRIVERGCS